MCCVCSAVIPTKVRQPSPRLHGMQNYQNRQSRQISPAQFLKKILHQRGTLPGEYPCRHLRLRMKQLAARRGISPFRIGSPVYDTPHLRPSSSSRTHHAGFDGHIKRTFVQVFPPAACMAAVRACISACAVESRSVSTRLCPRPTIRPDATTTAPIGTSSSFNALRASEIAARIKNSSSCRPFSMKFRTFETPQM